jgi:hypothetical protein
VPARAAVPLSAKMPQAAEQCALPKNLVSVPNSRRRRTLACYQTSLRLNGTSLFRSIVVGRNFRHIPRWLDYRRWRHNFRFLFLGFGVHNVAFSLLPLGVDPLLKLTFLTRAGPAPLRHAQSIASCCVLRVPSASGRALANKASSKQETVMTEADLFGSVPRRPYVGPAPNPRAQMRGTH